MALAEAPLHPCDAPEGGRAHWLHTADGLRIRFALWPGPRGQVLILPGRTEYIEKYGLVVADLAGAGWGAVVIDWRGQGLSDRLAGDARLGHVGRFTDYQQDLQAVLGAVENSAAMPWIAHSMGGCIALRALIDGARPPAAVFSAPMLGLPQSPAMRLLMRGLARVTAPLGRDRAYVPTTGPDYGLPTMGFDDNPLTRDREQFDRMQAQIRAHPALTLGGPSLRWIAAALAEMAALARQPAPPVRALIGLGDNERVVEPGAIRRRAAGWPSAQLVDYAGAEHELLMERPETRNDLIARALTLFNDA